MDMNQVTHSRIPSWGTGAMNTNTYRGEKCEVMADFSSIMLRVSSTFGTNLI